MNKLIGAPCRYLALFLIMLLLPVARISSATAINSGSVQYTAAGTYGSSAYTAYYQFPSNIVTGSNLTIQVSLTVDKMTGLNSYLLSFRLVATVSIDASHTFSGSAEERSGLRGLYPGAHWGPVNITIPVTESNTGVMPGGVKNANLSIALYDEVWVGSPISFNFPESSQGAAGQITIQTVGQNPVGVQPYFPYLLLLIGSVILALALLLTREGKPPKRERIRMMKLPRMSNVSG